MIAAGEDPRFIARRLVILASEDVGMADPLGLLIADAAARAVEFVGLPEAQLNLAHAVIHLATAPKSNSVITALGAAQADVASQPAGQVPPHLRDAHYRSAARIGHGVGYRYPHDEAEGWVDQQYRPDHLEDRPYYRPSEHGREPARIESWLRDRRRRSR
jgi:putative ATPase